MWQGGEILLDIRKSNVLLYLLKQNKFTTIAKISSIFEVSNRTIRYDLDSIDNWLEKNNFSNITRVPRKGIILDISGTQKEEIKKLLETKKHSSYSYILNPEERQNILAFYILNSNEIINLSELAEKTYVSIATISNDLDEIEKWFKKYNIELIRKKGYGIYAKGLESNVRRVCATILKRLATIDKNYSTYNIDNHLVLLRKWFPKVDLYFIKNQIVNAENMLNLKFSDDDFINLLTHIALAIERIKLNKDITIKKDLLTHISEKEEYKVAEQLSKNIAKHFNIVMPIEEISYIALHLRSGKVSKVANKEEYIKRDKNLLYLIERMVEEVEKELNIVLPNKTTLQRDLYIHLKPAIERMRYGNPFENPLLKQVKDNYTEVFNACSKIIKIIENEYNILAGENEISYIAMHFGAAIELQKAENTKDIKVLLICASGIGTSKLLKSQLINYFNGFQIIDTISYQEAKNYNSESEIDLIISTIPINSFNTPVITVTPLLNEKDIKILSNYLNYSGNSNLSFNNAMLTMEVIDIVSKHSTINNMEKLQFELTYLFNNINKLYETDETEEISSNLLPLENIQVQVECSTWEESIHLASKPLLDKRCISPEYVEKIIERLHIHGPYMVVAPGIAIPHAGIEEGVYKTGISIMTLKKPVPYNHLTNDPVHTVIVLAAQDNYTHVETLTHLINILSLKDNIEVFKNSHDPMEIYKLINK